MFVTDQMTGMDWPLYLTAKMSSKELGVIAFFPIMIVAYVDYILTLHYTVIPINVHKYMSLDILLEEYSIWLFSNAYILLLFKNKKGFRLYFVTPSHYLE